MLQLVFHLLVKTHDGQHFIEDVFESIELTACACAVTHPSGHVIGKMLVTVLPLVGCKNQFDTALGRHEEYDLSISTPYMGSKAIRLGPSHCKLKWKRDEHAVGIDQLVSMGIQEVTVPLAVTAG